jgi:hypothetical protein
LFQLLEGRHSSTSHSDQTKLGGLGKDKEGFRANLDRRGRLLMVECERLLRQIRWVFGVQHCKFDILIDKFLLPTLEVLNFVQNQSISESVCCVSESS